MERTRSIINAEVASVHDAAERLSRAIAELSGLTTGEKVMIAIGSVAGVIAGGISLQWSQIDSALDRIYGVACS
jgi:hypothetical protein